MSSTGVRKQPTGWVGWIFFAGLILIMVGGFNIIDGLVAAFKHTAYATPKGQLVVLNYTAWGWVLIVIGALQVLVGFALMRGSLFARIIAIILATISAISQIGFITAYPLWSILVIAVDILILWALILHGDETAQIE
jgi:uncharacterized membrane protein